MANITMPLDRRARLPRRCMVCGTKDCDFERVTIRPSVGAGGMVALATRDSYSTLTLTLPLCTAHRYHFAFQTILRFVMIGGMMSLMLLGLVLLAIFDKGWIVGVMVVIVLGMVTGWFIISMIANKSRVHISGYSGDTVSFTNVSSKFACAYEQSQDDEDEVDEDEEDEEDEEDRPRRNSRRSRRREDDDDDEDEFNFDNR